MLKLGLGIGLWLGLGIVFRVRVRIRIMVMDMDMVMVRIVFLLTGPWSSVRACSLLGPSTFWSFRRSRVQSSPGPPRQATPLSKWLTRSAHFNSASCPSRDEE